MPFQIGGEVEEPFQAGGEVALDEIGQEALTAGISPEDIQAGVTATGIRSVPLQPEITPPQIPTGTPQDISPPIVEPTKILQIGAAPKRGFFESRRAPLPPNAGRFAKIDRAFDIVVGTPLRVGLKFAKGLTFNVPDLAWAAIKKITPDSIWDSDVKKMTLDQAMDWAAGHDLSGFEKLVGDVAEFAGRIKTAKAIGTQSGILAKDLPKGANVLDKAIESAKLFGLGETGRQFALFLAEAIEFPGDEAVLREMMKPRSKEEFDTMNWNDFAKAAGAVDYGYEGAVGVLKDMGLGFGLSLGNSLIAKPILSKAAQSQVGKAIIETYDRAMIEITKRFPVLVDTLRRNPSEQMTKLVDKQFKARGIDPAQFTPEQKAVANHIAREFEKRFVRASRNFKPTEDFVRAKPKPKLLPGEPARTQPARPVAEKVGVKPKIPVAVTPKAEITPPERVAKPEIARKPLPAKEVTAEKGQEGKQAIAKEGIELEDLEGNAITTNEDGTITLFHRTSTENADKIKSTGEFVSEEQGEVFFSTKEKGQAEGFGDGLVEIRIDPSKVALDDAFSKGEVHVSISNKDLSLKNIARPAQPVAEPEGEVVVTKPSEAITKIPKAPKVPVTETPLVPLKGKEAQVFREAVRTQEKITAAEAGEVGIEPAGMSFSDHISTFQSYQLPETSQIPRITKQMKKINGLRLAGKITPVVANKRIHKLRQLLIQQAIKEKIALRVNEKGKVKIALRESGVFVPEEVATYKKYKNIEPILGGGQDITRAIQQMDGALAVKEKLQTKGQAGPIERFVLWRTRKMTIQKLNWLKEKTIEIKDILSAKKGSAKDKEINLILEKIGTADRDTPIKNILSKKTLASFSKESIKSAQELRQFYDELIEEQNAARLMRGQDEIPYRENYSPQILRDTTVWEQLFLRDKTAKILEKKVLPDYIKPNAPFNPRAQAREGDVPYDKRVLSARELAESYIITASKDIFNTSIIQNNKAFIDQLRGQGLEKAAEYLAEWTATSFAGIKPRLDRAIKLPKWAQGSLRFFNRLRNLAVFPLNVAWSLSTQPLSLSNTIGRYGLPSTVKGFFQWLKPSVRKQAAQDYFSFIIKTTKRGGVTKQDAGNLLGENIKTQKTVGEFVENFSTILLTEMEKLLTGTSIRAAHIQGVKRGLKGEALKNFASDGGGKTQSMYNDEDKPMILRSLLVKSGAPYQTYAFEVANTFREWAGRTGTPPDSKLYAMWSLTRWVAALTVLKMIANTVRGRKWSWWDLIPIPFREFWLTPIASKLTGEFVPGSSGLPSPVETGTRVAKGINDVLETGSWRKLRNEMIKYGPGVFNIPGGVQWARMVDAIIVYSSGGLTDRRGRVMFEMKDVKDLARAMFTGVWTTKEAQALLEKRKGKKAQEKPGISFKFKVE